MLDILQKLSAAETKLKLPKSASYAANDFIPFCEHFDARTIITKNGELLQTIRIATNTDGLNYEHHDDNIPALRDLIRSAIMDSVYTDNIGIWIHTLRKREQVKFDQNFTNKFAAYVNDSWNKLHGWSHRYYNEVYVTLIYDGQACPMFTGGAVKESINPKNNRLVRRSYIDAVAAELHVIMDNVIERISQYYLVHPLSTVERIPVDKPDLPTQPIYYSEPMEFFSYLLNLRDDEVPLPEASIYNSLQSSNLLIGFNALETKTDSGKKRFAAILSLKNYREVPVDTVDMLLQSPIELIISQAFHFIPHDKALKQYREQREYFENSEDTYSMEATGLVDILRGNRKQTTDFGHQQTSFMVLVDELKKLDIDVGQLQEAFGAIGLICVREDIRLEEVFWSTFPGNFEFLRRKDPINTHFIGGFARLNRFSSGQSTGTLWAQPIGLLPTLVNSPYFFNFHAQDNGHTLWMDFNSFNDKTGTVLLSFLLTQTQKLGTKLFYFDQQQSAALWFNKMNTPYLKIGSKKKNALALNPFSLPAEPRNIGFLTAWCSELIDADATDKAILASQLRAFFEQDKPRSLSAFATHLHETDANLAARFSPWVGNGEFAELFASSDVDFAFTADWLAFAMDEVMASPRNAVAALSYLLHRIVTSLDGTPTIIVMRDMLNIMSHPFFTSRLESLLEMLKENNVMVIFAENSNNPAHENAAMQLLTTCCASIIVVPDDLKQDYATVAPNLLTVGDEKLLWRMERMKGDVLVIQSKETVALRIFLDTMNDVESIFSNDVKTLIASGGPYASVPEANNG